MRYRVLIRAFTLRRDLCQSYVLAKLLERQGCSVVIACCRNFKPYLEKWNPHAVVVNTTGAVQHTVDSGSNAIIFHWAGEGGVPKDWWVPIFISLGKKYYSKIEKILLWGQWDYRHFDAIPDLRDKCVVTGSAKIDMVKYFPKIPRDNGKKSIGIVGRFTCLNNYSGQSALVSLCNPVKRQDILDEVEQFSRIVRICKHIIDKTDYVISYRPHPLESPENLEPVQREYFGKRFTIDSSYDFVGWLQKQDIVLAPASSTMFETYLMDKPVINLDKIKEAGEISIQYEFNRFLYSGSIHPESYEEVFSLLDASPRAKVNDEEMVNWLNDMHFVNRPDSAIKAAADEIVKTLKEKKFTFRPFISRRLINLYDWYLFLKSMYHGSKLHANFNYMPGYHRIPTYYDEIVKNILENKIQKWRV